MIKKISPFGQRPIVREAPKVEKKVAVGHRREISDEISFSESHERLFKIDEEARVKEMTEIRKRIKAGAYAVDSKALAEKIIERFGDRFWD